MATKTINILPITLLFLLGAIACKTRAYPPTGEVRFLQALNPGEFSLEATGYGRSYEDAEWDTYKTAFSALLFKGITGHSSLQRPMVEDEAKARSSHGRYFHNFFEQRGYLQFVTQKGAVSRLGKADDGRNKTVTRVFSVNLDALRRELEKQEIVRKFGL